MLLVVQAVAIALGAVPVYWLARKHLGSAHAGVGFALAYLLYPATGWLTLNEFHPVALATPLLLFAFWYLDEDRLLPFAALRAARLTPARRRSRSSSPASASGMRSRAGRWLAGGAIAAARRRVGRCGDRRDHPALQRRRSVGLLRALQRGRRSAGGILKTAFTDPLRLLEAAFSTRDLRFLLQLVAPLGRALPPRADRAGRSFSQSSR